MWTQVRRSWPYLFALAAAVACALAAWRRRMDHSAEHAGSSQGAAIVPTLPVVAAQLDDGSEGRKPDTLADCRGTAVAEDADVTARRQCILEEYKSLREETLRRVGFRYQLYNWTLVVAGTFLSVGISQRIYHVLLVYPVLAYFFAAGFVYNTMLLIEIGHYLREFIEGKHGDIVHLEWATYLQPRYSNLETFEMIAGYGLFCGTQLLCLSVAVGLAYLDFNFRIDFVGRTLIVFDVVSIILTLKAFGTSQRYGERVGHSSAAPPADDPVLKLAASGKQLALNVFMGLFSLPAVAAFLLPDRFLGSLLGHGAIREASAALAAYLPSRNVTDLVFFRGFCGAFLFIAPPLAIVPSTEYWIDCRMALTCFRKCFGEVPAPKIKATIHYRRRAKRTKSDPP